MNLLQYLGIQSQSITAKKAVVSVEVSDKLKQPYGIVHGGINTVLAETAASLGANKWLINQKLNQIAIGINITTDHLLPVADGKIKVIATPLKCGHTIQTWLVKEYNHEKLSSTSIVTLANRKKERQSK